MRAYLLSLLALTLTLSVPFPAFADAGVVEAAGASVVGSADAGVVGSADAGVADAGAVAAATATGSLKLDSAVVAPAVTPPSVPAGSGGASVTGPASPGGKIAAPETDEEALKLALVAIELGKTGSWSALVGVLLMLGIYALKRFNVLAKVPPEVLPWVTMGIGLGGTMSVTLANGGSWVTGLVAGVATGAFATFVWEAVGKRFLGSKASAAPPTV